MTATGDAPTAAGRKGSPRPLRVRALVAGLAPAVLPMTIAGVSRAGMVLALDATASAIDDRWAVIDTGVLVIFVTELDGRRERVTVHGRLRRRTPEAVELRLVAVDERTVEALRSVVRSARAGAKRAAAASRVTREMVDKALIDCVDRHAAAIVAAYLDALGAAIAHSRDVAQAHGDTKKFVGAALDLDEARPRVEAGMVRYLQAQARDFLQGESGNHDGGRPLLLEGGLSLVESTDLRAALAVTDVVNKVAARLTGLWAPLQHRLALLTRRQAEDCGLAPALLCHHLRDTLFHDESLGALRFVDLTAGLSNDFVARLEALYGELNGILDRHGVRAQVRATPDRRSGR